MLTVETDIYDLHPLIRDYLAEQFKEHPQHSEIKQAFCDLFVRVAGNIEQSTTLAEFNLIEPHLKKMVDWCEGNEDHQFAFSLNQLATLYRSQGKYNEAEPLYLRSLSIYEKQLGENHPNIATSLNNLAGLYKNQGKYNEAEPLYLRSLSIREKQLGEDHPHVAASLNNLALLYDSQGKYNEAESLYQRALQICEQTLGIAHPTTMTVRGNYAQCLKNGSLRASKPSRSRYRNKVNVARNNCNQSPTIAELTGSIAWLNKINFRPYIIIADRRIIIVEKYIVIA